jgi:hypothetical protein
MKRLILITINIFLFVVTFPLSHPLYALPPYCQAWSSAEAFFKINPNIGDAQAGTAEDQILAHISGAFAWNNEGASNFDYHYDGTTSINYVSDDGSNVIFATSENGSGVLSQIWCYESLRDAGGFDIKFFDGDVVWSGPGNPDSTQADIWSVSAHMMGHGLGLGHTPSDSATMHRFHQSEPGYLMGSTHWRDLDSNDITRVQTKYSGQPDVAVRIIPDDPRASFGPAGGTWTFDITLENTTDSTRTTDIWFDVRLPNGATYGPILGPFYGVSFSPYEVKSANNINLQMLGGAPVGVYVVRLKSGSYTPFPGIASDVSHVGLQKTAAIGVSDDVYPAEIIIEFKGEF